MKKNLSIERLLSTFVEHLRHTESESRRLSHIAGMGHGFEGWLKFEMAAMLCRPPWNYLPWVLQGRRWIAGDVGVEHRARLQGPKIGAESKLIDVWASPTPGAKKWHFVELKVVFNNFNKQKMAASWRADFDALSNLAPQEKPAGVASLLFGVDFTSTEFASLTQGFTLGLSSNTVLPEEVITRRSRNGQSSILLRSLIMRER